MFQTPDRVTQCIEAALQDLQVCDSLKKLHLRSKRMCGMQAIAVFSLFLQPGAVHNIVWYENPKMTIPEVYHVQVFWSKVD